MLVLVKMATLTYRRSHKRAPVQFFKRLLGWSEVVFTHRSNKNKKSFKHKECVCRRANLRNRLIRTHTGGCDVLVFGIETFQQRPECHHSGGTSVLKPFHQCGAQLRHSHSTHIKFNTVLHLQRQRVLL